MDLDKIISKGMLPVIRKRDILKARTLSRDEKKNIERGGPDILAISPSGQKIMLRREEVIKNYTYLDGKRISMAGWNSSKQYLIARLDNSDAVAMMVPLNCTANVNGIKANNAKRSTGDYIVGLIDGAGSIDQSTIGIIPSAIFKKMYYMPPNDVITRNLRGNNKLYTPYRQKPPAKNTEISFTKQLGIDAESIDFGDSILEKQPVKPVNNTNMNLAKPKQETTYKYMATGRLVNQSGETIGFIIQNKAGQTKEISKGQMMELCKRKLVSNIMLGVKSDTGTHYLRGNNIRIEMLPTYQK